MRSTTPSKRSHRLGAVVVTCGATACAVLPSLSAGAATKTAKAAASAKTTTKKAAASTTAAPTTAAAPAAAAPASKGGGQLVYSTDSDPICIDPHQSTFAATVTATRNVVDSLIYQNPDTGDLEPWLATSWTVSPDTKSITFKLRTDVTFSDGSKFDASVVKANFDRIVDPATKSALAVNYLVGYDQTIVESPDTATVKFKIASGPFLQAVSQGFLGIEAPSTFKAGPAATCLKIVGTGPYVLDNYTPQKSVVLKKRPGYKWAPASRKHQGDGYLDQITITIVPEDGVRVGSLQSKQVDAIQNVPPRSASNFDDGDFRIVSREQAGLPYALHLNESKAPWSDIRVRQGIQAAIDVNEIVKTLYSNRYTRAWSVITPVTPSYWKPLEGKDKFNLNNANKLLDDAGYRATDGDGYRTKDGKRLTLEWPVRTPTREQRDTLAQLVQQQLKKVGIEVKLTPTAPAALSALVGSGTQDVLDYSFVRADADVLRGHFYGKAGGGASHVKDDILDTWLEAGQSTVDRTVRVNTYEKAQRWLIDAAVAIPIYNPVSIIGVKAKLKDLGFEASGLVDFYDAYWAN